MEPLNGVNYSMILNSIWATKVSQIFFSFLSFSDSSEEYTDMMIFLIVEWILLHTNNIKNISKQRIQSNAIMENREI